jgi:hypothetical protein
MLKPNALALLVLLCLPLAFSQTKPVDAEGHQWWQHAVFYEIYPRSFADSNGDGIGDLNGIDSKLNYLKDLGVDAIWITPCFPSPQVDFGYDVSDYENIDPICGTLDDFTRLAIPLPGFRVQNGELYVARVHGVVVVVTSKSHAVACRALADFIDGASFPIRTLIFV